MECNKLKIAPSILSANFSHLQEDVDKVEDADVLHLDVMDGHFVPNITFGPVVLKDLKTKLYKQAHLMITNPEKYIEAFVKAGADNITIHAETGNLEQNIDKIHSLGADAGITINPDTSLDAIKSVVDKVELVLLMTVYPGFGGQKFISDVVPKIRELRELCPGVDIQVDGGINLKTIKVAYEAGANVIVAGSFIFNSDDPKARIEALRKAVE
jgi:ribulose-phosphate 3-epimerase